MTAEEPRDRAMLDVPWARRAPARGLRELVLVGLLGPAMDAYTRRERIGREQLSGLEGPVIFVANHSSHMDTPAILRALPARWRWRTAVTAAADYFYCRRGLAGAVSLLFNTVPIQRNGGALEPGSAAPLGNLIAARWNLLFFAEGTRSRDGGVGRLRSGAAVLAAEHGLCIVPIHVSGTHAAMPPGSRWMSRAAARRRPVEIRFGAPIRPRPGEGPMGVMERVRLFFAESGATTTPGAPAEAPAGEGGRASGDLPAARQPV
ncbi:MAG: lysophospholipid acyltransferase family protein [Thermoleophilaceae bacterium]